MRKKKIFSLLIMMAMIIVCVKNVNAYSNYLDPFYDLNDDDSLFKVVSGKENFDKGSWVREEDLETKTSSYVYGKTNLWTSCTKIPTQSSKVYYLLLIDAKVWAEGKHNSRTWFSTKQVNLEISTNSTSIAFKENLSLNGTSTESKTLNDNEKYKKVLLLNIFSIVIGSFLSFSISCNVLTLK